MKKRMSEKDWNDARYETLRWLVYLGEFFGEDLYFSPSVIAAAISYKRNYGAVKQYEVHEILEPFVDQGLVALTEIYVGNNSLLRCFRANFSRPDGLLKILGEKYEPILRYISE